MLTGPNKTLNLEKSKREILEIILHCSATAEGKDFHAKDIDRWHRNKGWDCIGYNYVVDLDGTIEIGRHINKIGAHTVGHNQKSIGICYIGGLASDGKTAKDTRTEAQITAMHELVDELKKLYPRAFVFCHNQFDNKACPSFKMDKWDSEFVKHETDHIQKISL